MESSISTLMSLRAKLRSGEIPKETSEADETSKALTLMMLNIYVSMMNTIISEPGMKDNEIEMYTLPEESYPRKDPIARKSTQAKFKLKI